MNSFSIIFIIFCIILSQLNSIQSDSTEEGDHNSAYMDALVATMELLYSLRGTFRSVASEFKRMHEKLGIDITRVNDLLLETDNILDRDIEEVQNKFQETQVSVDRMTNPLRKWTVELVSNNFDTLKNNAEQMENQYVREMVTTIKDQIDQGVTDLCKFQEKIEEMMQIVNKVAMTAQVTTRRIARVYGTTTPSFL